MVAISSALRGDDGSTKRKGRAANYWHRARYRTLSILRAAGAKKRGLGQALEVQTPWTFHFESATCQPAVKLLVDHCTGALLLPRWPKSDSNAQVLLQPCDR